MPAQGEPEGSCGIPLSSLHPHHPPLSPHVSQDDDLRVFTCASPPPPCKDELDASPSALVPWLPWPSPGQQLGLHPAPPFLFSYQGLIIRREKERKQQLHLEPQKFAGCSLFISSYLVFQYNTVISLDWLGP